MYFSIHACQSEINLTARNIYNPATKRVLTRIFHEKLLTNEQNNRVSKKSCGIFIEFSIVHKIGYNNAI